MPSTGYVADTFVAGEQPTTAKWNELWGNDASFNSGNGFNDNILVTRHFATSGLQLPDKMLNPYKFSVYWNAGAGSWLAAGTPKKVPFDTKLFDTSSNYDGATNFRFTAPINGFYHFDTQLEVNNGNNSAFIQVLFYKNGTITGSAPLFPGSGLNNTVAIGSIFLQLNSGDYIEVYAFSTTGAWGVVGGATGTWFSGFLVSAT